MMEVEHEEEIEHVCPKCKHRWKTRELFLVYVEPNLADAREAYD